MTTERKARELLAEEYERDERWFVADCIRRDASLAFVERRALRAIARALESAGQGEAAPCEDCEGSGVTGNVAYQGLMEPPEHEACPSCGGSGKWRVAPHQPEAQAVPVAWVIPEDIDNVAWHDGHTTPGIKPYSTDERTQPLYTTPPAKVPEGWRRAGTVRITPEGYVHLSADVEQLSAARDAGHGAAVYVAAAQPLDTKESSRG